MPCSRTELSKKGRSLSGGSGSVGVGVGVMNFRELAAGVVVVVVVVRGVLSTGGGVRSGNKVVVLADSSWDNDADIGKGLGDATEDVSIQGAGVWPGVRVYVGHGGEFHVDTFIAEFQ